MRLALPLPQASTGRLSHRRVVVLAGLGHTIPGFSLSLWGDVPLGSGCQLGGTRSSNCAGGSVAYRRAIGSRAGPLCQRAENEFVGANCGIMDQFISANGKENHALLLDCRDLSFKLAPIPDHVALVIANTMVNTSVAGGDIPPAAANRGRLRVIAGHRPGVNSCATPHLRISINGATKWRLSRSCARAT